MSSPAQLFQTAIAHHQAGRRDEAERAYRQLLLEAPGHADALRLLGGLYLQAGQMGLAAEYLEKAAVLLPKDAETQNNLGVALRELQRPEQALARYREALRLRPDYKAALANLGSLCAETGDVAQAEAAFGQVSRLDPVSAVARFNYGNSLLTAGKTAEAVVQYEAALKIRPDYLEAMINLGLAYGQSGQREASHKWLNAAAAIFDKILAANPLHVAAMNNLGNVLRQMGRTDEAVALYRRALQIKPDYAEAAINLGVALRDLGQVDEAVGAATVALKLRPDSAEARINLGIFLQDLMRHEEALTLFDEAMRLKPSSIDAPWNKCLSLLALGRYRDGWALHECGLGIPHMRGEFVDPDKMWRGEDLAGKRLLLRAEQGFGDSLQFVRYAALCKARGAVVSVLCPAALRPLFAHCPSIDALPEQAGDFDFHVPMMSLPYLFGSEVETIPASVPYLFVGAEARAWAAKKMAGQDGFKVGLVWAGNPRENQLNARIADRRRSMDLDRLRPLFGVEGVRFYSLQAGAAAGQIDRCSLRDRIVDFMGEVKNFEDTGALIEQMDLVISVDTAVVHVAGGLGKPVWVLSRFDACWRWLGNRSDSPWYPLARVFGQESLGDWDGVVERVRAALAEEVK